MPDRVALYLQDTFPLRDTIRYVQYAESRGFEAVWQAESDLNRDATVPMAAFATVTNRINIGSGIINIWTRHIATIASTFATLDDLATDRLFCGLGAWHDPVANKVGVARNRPLLAMREVVQALRELFAGKRVNFQGQFVNLRGVSLTNIRKRPTPRRIPLYIGATGPQMMALAGEIADGLLLNYMVSPQYTQSAINQVEIGVRQAGRTLEQVERLQIIPCAVNRNRDEALNRARRLVLQYIRQQPNVMKASGIRQELIDELWQALPWPATSQQIEDAMHIVPDDVVQLVTAAGTPEECRGKVREYMKAGATCPVLYPIGSDVNFIIDTFAYGYSA